MNCREAQRLFDADQDGALTESQRAALARHRGDCPVCREYEMHLQAMRHAIHTDAASAALPDIEAEIRVVQNQLHPPKSRRKRTLARVIWFGAPLAAAAAIMFAFLNPSQKPQTPALITESITQVDYVVTGNPDASTMVYVDQYSGWLVVWASTPIENHSG